MKIIFRPNFAPQGTFAPRKVVFASRKPGSSPPSDQKQHRSSEPEITPRRGLLATLRHDLRQGSIILGGASLGAGLMYMLDPDRGRRRRATARDQMVEWFHEAGDTVEKGVRDLNNRVSGRLVGAISSFIPDHAGDDVLRGRIRTAMGHCVRHPQAITVTVNDGQVTLGGHVLKDDMPRLRTSLGRLRGIRTVIDQLTVHDQAGEVPDMQGKPNRISEPPLLPRNSPAVRLGTAVAASGLAIYGMRRRGFAGLGLAAMGLGMAMRALKRPQSHSFSSDHQFERGVDLQKTITIDAPVDRVFRTLANFESFPMFLSHVREVKKVEDNIYRWTVTGPAGGSAHWEAEIVRQVPDELLEWKTRPGAVVDHAGIVRVDPTPYGATRLHIRLSYRPPLGRLGIGLGELLSRYPKHMLDRDLACFKSLMEQGKTTAHHHKVYLRELKVS